MVADAKPTRRSFGLIAVVGAVQLSGCNLLRRIGGGDPATANPPPSDVAPTAPPPTDAPLLQVDRVDVRVLESDPVQIQAVVSGSLPDPCTAIGEIVQQREGNAMVVTITTVREPDVICAQVITPVEEIVALEGEFPSGEYTVEINGVVRPFRV